MATRLPQLPNLRRILSFGEAEYAFKSLVDYLGRLAQELTRAIDAIGLSAPVDGDYLVGSTNGTLTAERVVTDTATITWDLSAGGQAKANAVLTPITDKIDPFRGRYAPGSFTMLTGYYAVMVGELDLSGSQRADLQGDARLVILERRG